MNTCFIAPDTKTPTEAAGDWWGACGSDLRAKLQKAGSEQKAVKWDADSDSEETDEEDLKV